MRRRLVTVGVVAAVGVLVVAAAVDALQGSGAATGRRDASALEARPPPGRAALVRALRAAGIRGILVYSDRSCRPSALTLPELEPYPAPAERSCRFVFAGPHLLSVGPAVPDPRGSLVASCDGGVLELRSRYGFLLARGAGCAPAWTPSSALTAVRDGAAVELDFVPGRRLGRGRLVPRVLLSRAELAGAFRRVAPAYAEPSFRELAWISRGRLAAVVRAESRRGPRDVLALFRDGRLAGPPAPELGRLEAIRASPSGHLVAGRSERGEVVFLDRRGVLEPLALPTGSARAVTWSPGERWLAVATSDAVAFLRLHGDGVLEARRSLRIPVRASDLVWR